MSHNFHAITGPNGMCECGVRADGTVVTCGQLFEHTIAERLREAAPVSLPSPARPQVRGVALCHDCGRDYEDFPLDVHFPDDEWTRLCPEGGVLCAQCIAARASKIPGVKGIDARLEAGAYGDARAASTEAAPVSLTAERSLQHIATVLRSVVRGFKAEADNGVICTPPDSEERGVEWNAEPSRRWCSRCRARWATLFELADEADQLAAALGRPYEVPVMTSFNPPEVKTMTLSEVPPAVLGNDDPALAELLVALDALYPLPDDADRVQRMRQTATVVKTWLVREYAALEQAMLRNYADRIGALGRSQETT